MDDLCTRRDDRLGLLATQHHLRDFGRVSEVRDPRLLDDNAGLLEARLELGHERARDRIGTREQRRLLDIRHGTIGFVIRE